MLLPWLSWWVGQILAHADCNLEITPNEEFLKNMTASPCCQPHSAPCPNGFPGMESIFSPLSALQGVQPARPSLPPLLFFYPFTPPPLHPPPPPPTLIGRWLVLEKRNHNHCFCSYFKVVRCTGSAHRMGKWVWLNWHFKKKIIPAQMPIFFVNVVFHLFLHIFFPN